MRKTFPSVAQVRELNILAEHTIPKEWEDQNGHVNVQHYQTLYTGDEKRIVIGFNMKILDRV